MSKIKSIFEDYKVLLRNVPALVTLIFCVGTLAMNLAAGKIIFSLGNVKFTGGFILSFLPFLCVDAVTKYFGARAAIMLNFLSAMTNVCMVIFLAIVAAIPTPGQDYTAFNSVNGAVWYIALSSTVAFIVSGIVNALFNAGIGKLIKKNGDSVIAFYARASVSTFIGQALDNFIFLAGVYCVFSPLFGGFSLSVIDCLATSIVGGAIETVLELAFGWCGHLTCKKWKKEGIGKEYLELHGIQ